MSLILSFSISCKSNEEPNETPPPEPIKPPEEIPITPKHELEGTWIGYDEKDKLEFNIDSDGNITFSPQPALDYDDTFYTYTYKGQIVINNTFDYPFIVNLSNRVVAALDEPEGIFTFKNSSNCTADYTRILWFSSGGLAASATNIVIDFAKQ